MKRTRFDVIVVGAGMVGAALACALGLGGKRVALLEPHLPASFDLDAEPDLRVSAINRASQALFERLGVWQTLAAQRISPFENMTVWDATGSGEIHFDSAEMGETHLGHIIENRLEFRNHHNHQQDNNGYSHTNDHDRIYHRGFDLFLGALRFFHKACKTRKDNIQHTTGFTSLDHVYK